MSDGADPVEPGRPGPAASHVVMVVANDVSTDSRVKKEALALADGGARVTVLGVAPDGRRSLAALGRSALILRVPVAYALRDERRRRRNALRSWRPPLIGYRTGSVRAARQLTARLRLEEARTAARGVSGVAVLPAALSRLRWTLAARAGWLRAGVGTRADRAFKLGWRAWDGVVSRTTWPARWRGVHPEAYDYEAAFGPVLDQLQPDAIHAHDMHVIGVAVRAARRAGARGRRVAVVYDAHEYVPGLSRYGPRTPRFIAAWSDHEREYIGSVDRVVTVSPAIATALQRRYRLPAEPTVIINTPGRYEAGVAGDTLRDRLGLPDDVPLLVYSGGVTRARGVETAVEALPHLPQAHLAVVVVPHVAIAPVDELRVLAERLGVADRVHFVDPVEPEQVVHFLSSADVGLIPILRYPSHEMALPNKVFEYLFAGLPVVVSTMPSLTAFVEERGIGTVFQVGDAPDLADRVSAVLAHPGRYRDRVNDPALRAEVSWENQASRLRDLYTDLLARPLGPEAEAASAPGDAEKGTATAGTSGRRATPHLIIGPSNSAGQAWEWARAVERNLPTVVAESLMAGAGDFRFSADHVVSTEQFSADAGWLVRFADHVLRHATHVLFEAARPILGQPRGQFFLQDVPTFRSAGIAMGLVFHGSEVRDPRMHRARHPHSPFLRPDDPLTQRLQTATDIVRRHADEFVDGPKYVTTPDLLDYVAGSQWLPVVVDAERLASSHPVLERARPVVLHAPSRSALKGSGYVDPVLRRLDERGLVEYRRVEGVSHADLVALVQEADIVVDQLLLGSYGVFACEAMAAGRVTVGHVAAHVRGQLPRHLPIVEATPDEFEGVIERILSERDGAAKHAAEGPEYVRALHDGRESARVLAPFLTPGP